MPELGHVVLYVRDLKRSVEFYTHIVGLTPKGNLFNDRATMLTGGRTHHELLLIEVGDAPGPLSGRRVGLYHIGWKIGESLDVLRAARQRIVTLGHQIDGQSDHTVSQSLYLRDPDGNEIELYVDDPQVDWRESNAWMQEPVKPLKM